jgi:hypothetical protein
MTAFIIAKLTLRSILRERVALSMLALLAGVLLLLPAGLEGDGTLEGEVRMLIQYTLGFSGVLLAGMTLWVSCASISGDLTSKRLHMVLTKPVSRFQLWWGKWMAVTVLITGLMLISGLVTLFRVDQRVRAAELPPAESLHLQNTLLTARRPEAVALAGVTEEAEAILAKQIAGGWVPPEDLTEAELLRQVIQHVQTLRFSVRSGESRSWDIPLESPVKEGEPLQLSLTYDGASMGVSEIVGEWTFGTPDYPLLYKLPVSESPVGTHVHVFNENGNFDGASVIRVSFAPEIGDGRMVFFRTDNGIQLYRPGGSFAPNLFRAVLLLSGLLGLLAALGVSAGAVFSLPVACYATSMFLVIQAFSGVVEETVENGIQRPPDEEVSVFQQTLDTVRMQVYKGLLVSMKPLNIDHPLVRVSEGELISVSEVSRTLGTRFFPLLVVTGLVGSLLFRRREIGSVQ